MQKCHCGNVYFEEIYQYTLKYGKNPIDAMKELGAGAICTACVEECTKYIESRKVDSPGATPLFQIS